MAHVHALMNCLKAKTQENTGNRSALGMRFLSGTSKLQLD